MSERFLKIALISIVVSWGAIIVVSMVIGKSFIKRNKFMIIMAMILCLLIPVGLHGIAYISCKGEVVKGTEEVVLEKHNLISVMTVKGIDGNFSSSIFSGSGYVKDDMKIYFYIEENGQISLESGNYKNCKFVFIDDNPYMEVIEQYDTNEYIYSNNKFSKLLGLNFNKKDIQRNKYIKNIIYVFYVPEDSIGKYFNLDIPQ